MDITREQFTSWQENNVTVAVMKGLENIKEDLKEFLANGGTLPADSVSTDFIVGRVQGLNDFLNVDYEESTEVETDD